ncbi:MAG: HEAT repeat protein, partial [Myxococcota bacterium]
SEERLTLFLLQGTQSERMAAANALAERDTAAASEVLAAALPNAARSDRSSIVYALSRMGHPRAVETMRGLLRHPNPEIHHAAASALVYQRPDILASLDPASVPRGVRGHVFSALAAVDPEGALPVLTAAIRGGFGPDAQTAVTALANVPGDEARGILLEALDTGGPLMSSALNALGGVSGLPPEARGKLLAQIQSGSASPQLFYSLGSDGSGADASLQTALVGAIQNGSTQTRDAAAQALARAGGPQSAGLLASIITDPATDTATSRSALNALASAGGAEAARTVSALARDGDKDAIRALRMLDGKKSVDTLMEIYQGKDAALADEAFSVLSNSQQPEALDVLLDVAGSDSPRASTAIYGLAARHDPAAREAVLDAAWSGKTEVRRAAIGTLSNNAADADALPVLARGLHDDNASVATAAVNALRYRPGRAATQALVGVLGQDVPNSLKAQVAAALKTRGGKAARDNKALIDQALAETNPSDEAVAANPVRHWFTLDDVLTSPSFPGLLLE